MLPLGFAGFLVFGVVLVLLGANQAAMARDLGLDLAHSGLLVSGLALGIGGGVVGAGPVVDRLPRRPVFVAAALLAALALLGVDPQLGFTRAFLHVLVLGLGIGVHETVINASVADAYQERAARPIMFVHSAATLGAVLAPPLIGWLEARGHWTDSFHATGLGYLALGAAAFATRFPAPAQRRESGRRGRLSLQLLPFAAVSFAYVGIESALTIFAVPYVDGALALSAARGQAAISTFWLGLLAGRVPLLAVRRPVDARLLLAAGFAGAGVLVLGIGGSWPQPELVFFAAGASLGFVFPLMIALAAARFPEARGTATGLAAGAGACGGFLVPWIHGALGDRFGLVSSLTALACWSALIAGAAWVAWRHARA